MADTSETLAKLLALAQLKTPSETSEVVELSYIEIVWEAHKHPRLADGKFAPLGKGLFLLGKNKTALFTSTSGKQVPVDLHPGETLHKNSAGTPVIHTPSGEWKHAISGKVLIGTTGHNAEQDFQSGNSPTLETNHATVVPAKSEDEAKAALNSKVSVGDKVTAAQAALLPLGSRIKFQDREYKKMSNGDWYNPSQNKKMQLLASDQATVAKLPDNDSADQFVKQSPADAIVSKVKADQKHITNYADGKDDGVLPTENKAAEAGQSKAAGDIKVGDVLSWGGKPGKVTDTSTESGKQQFTLDFGDGGAPKTYLKKTSSPVKVVSSAPAGEKAAPQETATAPKPGSEVSGLPEGWKVAQKGSEPYWKTVAERYQSGKTDVWIQSDADLTPKQISQVLSTTKTLTDKSGADFPMRIVIGGKIGGATTAGGHTSTVTDLDGNKIQRIQIPAGLVKNPSIMGNQSHPPAAKQDGLAFALAHEMGHAWDNTHDGKGSHSSAFAKQQNVKAVMGTYSGHDAAEAYGEAYAQYLLSDGDSPADAVAQAYAAKFGWSKDGNKAEAPEAPEKPAEPPTAESLKGYQSPEEAPEKPKVSGKPLKALSFDGKALEVGDSFKVGNGQQNWQVKQVFANGQFVMQGDPTWASTAGGPTKSKTVTPGDATWDKIKPIHQKPWKTPEQVHGEAAEEKTAPEAAPKTADELQAQLESGEISPKKYYQQLAKLNGENPKVHLQGVGMHEAKEVRDLKVGDTVVYNQGVKGKVTGIKQVSDKQWEVTTEESGQTYTKKKTGTSLMGYQSPEAKAQDQSLVDKIKSNLGKSESSELKVGDTLVKAADLDAQPIGTKVTLNSGGNATYTKNQSGKWALNPESPGGSTTKIMQSAGVWKITHLPEAEKDSAPGEPAASEETPETMSLQDIAKLPTGATFQNANGKSGLMTKNADGTIHSEATNADHKVSDLSKTASWTLVSGAPEEAPEKEGSSGPKVGDQIVTAKVMHTLPTGTVLRSNFANKDWQSVTKQSDGAWKWENGALDAAANLEAMVADGNDHFRVESIPGTPSVQKETPETSAPKVEPPKVEPVPVEGKKNKLTAYNEADAPLPGDGSVAPIDGKDYTTAQLVSDANGFVHPVSKEFFPLEKGDQVLQHTKTPASFAVMGADGEKKFQVNKNGKKYKWSPHIPKSNFKVIATASKDSDSFDAGAEELPDGTQHITGNTFKHPVSGADFEIGKGEVLLQHNFTPDSYLVSDSNGNPLYQINVKGKKYKVGGNLKPSNYHPIFDGDKPAKQVEEPVKKEPLTFQVADDPYAVGDQLHNADIGTKVTIGNLYDATAVATKDDDGTWSITEGDGGELLTHSVASDELAELAIPPVWNTSQLKGMENGTKIGHTDGTGGWSATKIGPNAWKVPGQDHEWTDGEVSSKSIWVGDKDTLGVMASDPKPATHPMPPVSTYPDPVKVKPEKKKESGDPIQDFLDAYAAQVATENADMPDWEQALLAPTTTGTGKSLVGEPPVVAVHAPASHWFDAADGTHLLTADNKTAAVKVEGQWHTAKDYMNGGTYSNGYMASLFSGDDLDASLEEWGKYGDSANIPVSLHFPEKSKSILHSTATPITSADLFAAPTGSTMSISSHSTFYKKPDGTWVSDQGVFASNQALSMVLANNPTQMKGTAKLTPNDGTTIPGPSVMGESLLLADTGAKLDLNGELWTKQSLSTWSHAGETSSNDTLAGMLSWQNSQALGHSSLTLPKPDQQQELDDAFTSTNNNGTPVNHKAALNSWLTGQPVGAKFSTSDGMQYTKAEGDMFDVGPADGPTVLMSSHALATAVMAKPVHKWSFKLDSVPDKATSKLASKVAGSKVPKKKIAPAGGKKSKSAYDGGTPEPYSDFHEVLGKLTYYGVDGFNFQDIGTEEFRQHVLNKLSTAKAARDDKSLNLKPADKTKLTKAVNTFTALAKANELVGQMNNKETLDTDLLDSLPKKANHHRAQSMLDYVRTRAGLYGWEQSLPGKGVDFDPANSTKDQKIGWLKGHVEGAAEWSPYLTEYQIEGVFLNQLGHPNYASSYYDSYIKSAKMKAFKNAFLNSASNSDGSYTIAPESASTPLPSKPTTLTDHMWSGVQAALTGKVSVDAADMDAWNQYKAELPSVMANGVPNGVGPALLKSMDAVGISYGARRNTIGYLLKSGIWNDGSKLTYSSDTGEFPIPPGTKVYKTTSKHHVQGLYFVSPGVAGGDDQVSFYEKGSSGALSKVNALPSDEDHYTLAYVGPKTVSFDDAVKDGQTFDQSLWDKVTALEGTAYNTPVSGSDLVGIKKALQQTNSPAQPSELSDKAKQLIKANPELADIIAYKDQQGAFRSIDISKSSWADLKTHYAKDPSLKFLNKVEDPNDYPVLKDEVSKLSDSEVSSAFKAFVGHLPSYSNTEVQNRIALIKAIQQANNEEVSNRLQKPQKQGAGDVNTLLPISNPGISGKANFKYYVDADGNEYMAKPTDASHKFRADTEHAAGQIASMLGFNVPESQVRDINGEYSHIQKLVDNVSGDLNGRNPADLTDAQLTTVMSSHAIDWALSNHDTHGGNFLMDGSGNLVKIDVGQSWKALGKDKLQVGWELPGNIGGVWYDKFYKQVQTKKVDKDRLDTVAKSVLSKAAQISSDGSDKNYRDQLEFAFQNRTKFPDGVSKSAFIDKAMERKKSTLDDFYGFYSKLYKDGGYGDLPFTKESLKSQTSPGSDAGHYTVSSKLLEQAHKDGSHGHALFFGGQDIEDSHALVYSTKDGVGKSNLHADLKIREDGDKQITAFINANSDGLVFDNNPSSNAPAGNGPLDTLGATSALVDLAKTVSKHSADGQYNAGYISHAKSTKDQLQVLLNSIESNIAKDPKFVSKHGVSFQSGHQQQAWMTWASGMIDKFNTTELAMSQGEKAPKWDSSSPTYQAPKDIDLSGKPKLVEKLEYNGDTYQKYSDYNFVGPNGPVSESAYLALAKMPGAKTTVTDPPVESTSVADKPKYKIKQTKFSTLTGKLKDGYLVESGSQSFQPTAYEISSDAHPGITIQYVPHKAALDGGDKTNIGRLQIKVKDTDASDSSRLNDALAMLSDMGVDTSAADDQSMELFYWRSMLNTMQDRKQEESNSGIKATVSHAKEGYASGAADSPAGEVAMLKEAFAKQWGQSVVDRADWTPKFGTIDKEGTEAGRPYWERPDFDVASYRKASKGRLPSREFWNSDGGDPTSSALRPFKSGGFLSNEDRVRFTGEWAASKGGSTASSDRAKGGSATGVFLRQSKHPVSNAQYFEPDLVGRTSTWAYNGDAFGGTYYKNGSSPWTMGGLNQIASHPAGDNEIDPKYGVSAWDNLAVTIVDAGTRKKMLQWFKDNGISEIRGLPVEERVVDNTTDLDKTMKKVWDMAEERQKHNQEVAKGGGVGHGIGGK